MGTVPEPRSPSRRSGADLLDGIRPDVGYCDRLDAERMWRTHYPRVWYANRFVRECDFYPVYRFRDFYSYSPYQLILLKGVLSINEGVRKATSRPDFLYYSGRDTIDSTISRVGGPLRPRFKTKDPSQYAQQIADALREDTRAVEDANPGYVNVLLCGGKDSLNMAFIPWKNPVVIASAQPNHDLVRDFVEGNGLPYEVILLQDSLDEEHLKTEVLANCCRMDLQHCRWGNDLRRIVESHGYRAIIWTGAMADTLTTPKWRSYSVTHADPRSLSKRVSDRLMRLGRPMSLDHYFQQRLFQTEWYRGAMWQGVVLSIWRDVINCLVMSAYHGPRMRHVFSQVDIGRAVPGDIRGVIGRNLAGREVVYPDSNPSPPISSMRRDLARTDLFLRYLDSRIAVQ